MTRKIYSDDGSAYEFDGGEDRINEINEEDSGNEELFYACMRLVQSTDMDDNFVDDKDAVDAYSPGVIRVIIAVIFSLLIDVFHLSS